MMSHTSRIISLVVLTVAVGRAADSPQQTRAHWQLKGNLSEACTCQVPCGCNFRSGPSLHHFCWAMFSLEIRKGHYGKVRLNGLHLVAAHGDKAVVWYIDQRATSRQFAALKAIAGRLRYHTDLPAFFEAARITQDVTNKGNYVEIEAHGGFKANYLMGLDPKKPIVVENITAWNLPRSIKGRTEYLKYSDAHGNKLDFKDTNSNEGKFDWTDKTSEYF